MCCQVGPYTNMTHLTITRQPITAKPKLLSFILFLMHFDSILTFLEVNSIQNINPNILKYICVQGWTLAPVRPPAAGNFGVGQVHSEKHTSGWRVTFLTQTEVLILTVKSNVDVSLKT